MSPARRLAGSEGIGAAVAILRRGGVLALPTETCYGLAVDPKNPAALERLFAVKRRATEKPVLLLVRGPADLARYAADVPPVYLRLMARFWPGPLTLIFPARPGLHPLLTGGTATVGLRRSSHPLAQALTEAFGGPLTATSANRSGQPSLNDAAQVATVMGAELDAILDGGPTPGAASTVVGQRDGALCLLRAGALDFNLVRAASA